jgi:HNH endonuclease
VRSSCPATPTGLTATSRRIYNTEKWNRTRADVRRRAGGQCERCGYETKTLDVHHRIPLKDGGLPYDPDILEVLCRPCHRTLEHPGGSSFRSVPPTSRSVGISLPDSRNGGNSPRKPGDPRDSWRGWVSPDGRPWSRDWAAGSGSVSGRPQAQSPTQRRIRSRRRSLRARDGGGAAGVQPRAGRAGRVVVNGELPGADRRHACATTSPT